MSRKLSQISNGGCWHRTEWNTKISGGYRGGAFTPLISGSGWPPPPPLSSPFSQDLDPALKITAERIKRRYKYRSEYKRRVGWTNLRKIKTDWNCGFCSLVDLTVVFLSPYCHFDIETKPLIHIIHDYYYLLWRLLFLYATFDLERFSYDLEKWFP